MVILSKRVQQLEESATLAMAKKAREMKEKGLKVINLSLGEPDFDTAPNIKNIAIKAINEGFTKYIPVAGTKELREAICRKFLRENNLSFQANQIVVSNGAKQSIFNVCQALLDPQDEILLPSPYWLSYSAIANLAEAKYVEVKADVNMNYKVNASLLEKYITPKTKAILFSSPCNPSGAVYTKEELFDIVQLLKKYPRIIAISDEIYEYINFDSKHISLANFEEVKDRVVIINGFSKGYAMTGWRLGYIAAHKDIAYACEKIQSQVTSGTCSFNQIAAIEALDGPQDYRNNMIEEFRKRRDLVVGRMKEFNNIKSAIPSGAFYVLPDISYYFGKKYNDKIINSALVMSEYLLSEALVATVGGEDFGDDKCIRISYACSTEDLNEAFDRIALALNKLN